MATASAAVGGVLAGLAGGVAYFLGFNTLGVALFALAAFGVGAWLALAGVYRAWVPPAFDALVEAARTGFLLIAIGRDKKLRLIPGYSDGFVVRPAKEPYASRYMWAADSESFYTVHDGKGAQAAVVFMNYGFPVDAKLAAAVEELRRLGFKTLEELKMAIELARTGEVDKRIEELRRMREQVEEMDEGQVQELYGVPKQQLLEQISYEIGKLEGLREVISRVGDPEELAVYVDGGTVKAREVETYFMWRHHPAEVQRMITAEANRLLALAQKPVLGRYAVPIGLILAIIVGAYLLVSALQGGGFQPPMPVPNATAPAAGVP